MSRRCISFIKWHLEVDAQGDNTSAQRRMRPGQRKTDVAYFSMHACVCPSPLISTDHARKILRQSYRPCTQDTPQSHIQKSVMANKTSNHTVTYIYSQSQRSIHTTHISHSHRHLFTVTDIYSQSHTQASASGRLRPLHAQTTKTSLKRQARGQGAERPRAERQTTSLRTRTWITINERG